MRHRLRVQILRRGVSINLAGTAGVRIPSRVPPGTAASPFVGESQPIPARQLSFVGPLLRPFKCAVISLFTGEMAKGTPASIEAIISTALAEDIAAGIDTVLIGNTAATSIAPAGLLNGVTPLTPSAATDPATAVAADLSALAAAIVPAPTAPTFIMNGVQAASSGLLVAGIGGVDIIVSDAVPAKTVICVDSADFASSVDSGGINVSNDATIISRDDPAPVSQGASGASADTAAPHLSLFQVDCIGIKITEDVSWLMRRSGRVSYVTNIKW
ncbi:phage major capsid protein [Rhizobium grahamii]|uniref:Phage capsid-like C-terminal domain-containing protein n=1 Tax=Rhizobium grahamii TaxID=1120045 RepID=A0A370KRT5_9HYPH|nr:phage major capsid protein [Rhizobium grahamii]RDJ12870.1 hypothetical protein B5K06_08860 [Rhizobium grahamii]